MFFRQGDKQLGEPSSVATDGGRAQHESHNAHFIHLKNHNSYVCSLRLTSSQETSTHEFVNRAPLSWTTCLLRPVSHLYEAKKKILDQVSQCKGLSNATWYWLSFKQVFWEIWVNRVKMRVRSHTMARKMESSQRRIYFSSTLNKHQKEFLQRTKAATKDQNQW